MDKLESWTVPAEDSGHGYGFHVVVTADCDSRPEDLDCYSKADREAWKRDEWRYVVFTVTPFLDGVTFDGAADVLGGVEWGFLGGRWLDKEYAMSSHPVREMMEVSAESADEMRRNLA